MKARIAVYTLYIFLIMLIQSTVLEYARIYNVKPNLSIIFIVSVALLRGNVEGAAIGFFFGLSQDIIAGKVLGFYALLGLYLGLIIGSLNKRLYRENIFVVIFFTFIASFIYESIVGLVGLFSFDKIEMIFIIKNEILPESIYNSIVSIFIYVFVIKINSKFQDINNIKRKY
jgi:rod shape-determining protein MreD